MIGIRVVGAGQFRYCIVVGDVFVGESDIVLYRLASLLVGGMSRVAEHT